MIDTTVLRRFGLVVGLVLMTIGVIPVLKGGDVRTYLIIAACLLFLAAVLVPRLLNPLYRIWMRLGDTLGRINSFIILSIIFFFILTPIGLVMRSFKAGSMRFAFKGGTGSYWIKRTPGGAGEDMRRMF